MGTKSYQTKFRTLGKVLHELWPEYTSKTVIFVNSGATKQKIKIFLPETTRFHPYPTHKTVSGI